MFRVIAENLDRFKLLSIPAILILVSIILGHEFVKEGYLFNPADIFVPRITHEKLLMTVVATGLFLRHIKNKEVKDEKAS